MVVSIDDVLIHLTEVRNWLFSIGLQVLASFGLHP